LVKPPARGPRERERAREREREREIEGGREREMERERERASGPRADHKSRRVFSLGLELM